MGAGRDLFFIQEQDSAESPQVVRRSLDGHYTVLGSGYVQPVALTAGRGMLYFADAGGSMPPMSELDRYDCCSIWAIPLAPHE